MVYPALTVVLICVVLIVILGHLKVVHALAIVMLHVQMDQVITLMKLATIVHQVDLVVLLMDPLLVVVLHGAGLVILQHLPM
jgi:hypothetical protein